METILKLNKWANAHTNFGFDALRVLLGAFLFYKGMWLFSDANSKETFKMLETLPGMFGNLFLIHYIAMAHIFGGVLIAIGLFTRVSVLVQLPIVMAAVIVNLMGEMNVANLLQASLCLLVCAFFLFYGSGRNSVDHSLRMHI